MLMRFNVGNFLSFNDIQEFSMIGGTAGSNTNRIYTDHNIKLLKFAAIYGANASGKSNLITALDFMRETIVKGFPEGHTTRYCKVNKNNCRKSSYFELEIKIGNKYFSYGFEILLSSSSILNEWLVEILPCNEEREIFTRNVKKGEYCVDKYFSDLKVINKLEVYADDIKKDDSILFLKLMNRNKDGFYSENDNTHVLKNVYDWVVHKLDINYPDKPALDYSYFITNENINEINRIISAFGTGISRINIVEVSADNFIETLPKNLLQEVSSNLESLRARKRKAEDDGLTEKGNVLIRSGKKDFFLLENDENDKLICKTLEFCHDEVDLPFTLSEESDGTIRVLDFLEILLNETNEKIYIIDEIDRCLHPQLTYKFIETFLQLAAVKDIQLIVTTHESRLLDFNLLRRDEVWFVNKNRNGASSIYSLDEYNTRFDQKIDKAYLEGRYGGVPIFGTVFPIKSDDGDKET